MIALDAAVEDYLHLIVRTRPWTKKREEELLNAWCDWLLSRGEAPPVLAPELSALAREYADACGLGAEERAELLQAVTHLLGWAAREGLLPAKDPR